MAGCSAIASAFLCLVAIASVLQWHQPTVDAHSYHLGGCPKIEPMPDFNMPQLLGLWYVIQKTDTGSSCITYNFTASPEPDEYVIIQDSQHFALRLTPLDHNYRYSGRLTVPDSSVPAKMIVRFPLSVAGSASYTVFTTDYTTYAAIFTCQRLAFAHRQSATILSRTKTLDKLYVDKIRQKLSTAGIDPFELSIVDQKNCPAPNANGTTNIRIDDETISTKAVAGVIRSAGEKIGDGFEYIADGAKNVYGRIANDNESSTHKTSRYQTMHPDSEWLP